MPLQRSGLIGMDDVNLECGFSSTATIGLNDSRPRTLASKSSGQISLDDCYGCMYITEGSYPIYTYYSGLGGYYIGFYNGVAGSIGRITFSSGQTLEYCMDDTYNNQFLVGISGFGANPGQTGFWTSVRRNNAGTTINSSSASGYSYGAGIASWIFSGILIGAIGASNTFGYKWT